jgi:hypothetical protein
MPVFNFHKIAIPLGKKRKKPVVGQRMKMQSSDNWLLNMAQKIGM